MKNLRTFCKFHDAGESFSRVDFEIVPTSIKRKQRKKKKLYFSSPLTFSVTKRLNCNLRLVFAEAL